MAWVLDRGRESERRMLASRNQGKASAAPKFNHFGTNQGTSNSTEILRMKKKYQER